MKSELRLHLIVLFVFVVVMASIQKVATTCNDYDDLLDFFGIEHETNKPEFITTFDLMKLTDENYALKVFYCVIKEKPCDDVGERIKASISEELLRSCNRCSPIEKRNIERVISYVSTNFPDLWNRVLPLYKV